MDKKFYLFDFDGTLVNSMPAFGAAMKSVLDDFNVTYGDDIVKIVTPLGYEGSAKYFQSIGLDLPIDEILDIIRKKLVYASVISPARFLPKASAT